MAKSEGSDRFASLDPRLRSSPYLLRDALDADVIPHAIDQQEPPGGDVRVVGGPCMDHGDRDRGRLPEQRSPR